MLFVVACASDIEFAPGFDSVRPRWADAGVSLQPDGIAAGDGSLSSDLSAQTAADLGDSLTDAGQACQPTTERCDQRDNNCNGIVDDGFDLQNDPQNCGVCGASCGGAHAVGVCRAGRCHTECEAGYADCDGDSQNGCEARLDQAAHCGSCQTPCEPETPFCTAGDQGVFRCSDGCTDKQISGDETDVDCGGTRCAACDTGQRCAADRDCSATASCVGGVCTACGVCEPDVEQQVSCGACEAGVRSRRCTAQCRWSPWSTCDITRGLCSSGARQTRSCGRCGQQVRTCGRTCDWSAWGACADQGPCNPGQLQRQACGLGGTRSRRCSDGCRWGDWSACQGQGVCSPGANQQRVCGRCGVQRRSCGDNYRWQAWERCAGQGVCEVGSRQQQQCGRCDDGLQTRQCSAQCRWGSWSSCDVSASVCSTPGQILGDFELRANGSGYALLGWACDSKINKSVEVRVFAGGPAGVGTYLGAYRADRPHEAAVSRACETEGGRHRFLIPISAAHAQEHAGRRIYIHGISLRGGANRLIGNSGVPRLPSNDTAGIKLSTIARAGQDLTVRAGQEVVIDADVSIRLLRVEGTLRCRRDRGAYRLQVAGMLVSGRFECGTEAAPFGGRLDLAVSGGVELMSMGRRTIAAVQPGVISLHGDKSRAGWVKLAEDAAAGQRRIVVDSDVSFVAGDLLAIGPTGFDPFEAEQVRVARIERRRTVHLRQPLRFAHVGRRQRLNVRGRTRYFDPRAEVANLARNIRIYPTGTAAEHNYNGAHMMVMRGARAYVDAVEFSRMGRMGQMGRYPFHWHLAGNVDGQYIRNSSIHHSYQRCVTVHGSSYATVKNNVCYDHFGHGYFLEDGNEVKNRIEGNLGMLSRRVPQARSLLISDVAGNALRFSAPATFWIAHPDNYIVGNVAAGSQGTGFWMAFSRRNGGAINKATWAFNDNSAHSSEVGITWDGAPDGALRNNPRNPNDRELVSAHYSPPKVPTFRRLIAFKNLNAGVYFRGTTVRYDDNLYADNGWSLFFAFNQVVSNSVIIGHSQATSGGDLAYLRRRNRTRGQYGIVLYDGPFDLSGVDFLNFPRQRVVHQGVDYTAIPFGTIGGHNRYTNRVSDLRFSPEPYRRVLLARRTNWLDSPWSASLRDSDGSLTGRAGAMLVPDHPFNTHASCQRRAQWNALVCDYELGQIFFGPGNSTAFRVLRSDGVATLASASEAAGRLHNKFHAIIGQNLAYTVEFAARRRSTPIRFQADRAGALSPVIRLRNLGFGCRVPLPQAASLDALRRGSTAAYFLAGGDVYLRLQANRRNNNASHPAGAHSVSATASIACR